ncbi:TetR/AcrR family transcriptional regulator [Rhizobacter sp. SG703]|uniref:TetR/AcrR family transcriptional regulator n=1 Tax=Rhizobacter sp. SG703 TaxID=2587140 RepID=UPI001446BA04|nr:TetR/AcrR family transcriptional regulator [Rhizobacter sp. SG703]NKI92486.1 AcrR family transcriptional regulator [Rhizobacter sp. SG703]
MTKTPPRRSTRIDGDQTYTRILEAAGPLFAATGFAETTSKSIAAEAGADVASINYHFGSRNGLYQTVLAEAHRRLIRLDTLQDIAGSGLPASDKLARLIDTLLAATTGEHGWPVRVLAREVLAPTSNARLLLDAEIEPKLVVVQGVLSEVSGIPRGDPALLRCMVSVAAPCLMLLVAGNGLPGPIRPVLTGSSADLAAHLHAFALAGLHAVGQQYRDRPRRRKKAP